MNMPQVEFFEAGQGFCHNDGWVHCKTVPFYILAYTRVGRYELTAGSESIRCATQDAFFTAPNLPLAIRHIIDPETGYMELAFIHFYLTDSRGQDVLAAYRFPGCIVRSALDEIRPELERLIADYHEDDGDLETRCRIGAGLFRVLAWLIGQGRPVPVDAPLSPLLEKARNWIAVNCAGSPDVPALVRHMGVSRTRLYDEFLSGSGRSPAAAIREMRIKYAQRLLLRHPELSIKEVAEKCRWTSQFHFSRSFHAETGMSPSEFRRRMLPVEYAAYP